MEHTASIRDDNRVVAYSEVHESGRLQGADQATRSRYIVCETPLKIQSNKAPPEKANPKIGIGEAQIPFLGFASGLRA